MKKTIFWIGVAILVVGIIVFGYAYTTIQNIRNEPIYRMWVSLDPQVESQWNLAQTLRPIGLGLLALGAIMLLYGVFVKK